MSLAAVPVFLWGRSLMAARWALVAAALTLALPGLAYSGLVMTEVVFYPVFVLAAWATAAALASPTRGAAGAARRRGLPRARDAAAGGRAAGRDRDGVRARRRDRAPPAVARAAYAVALGGIARARRRLARRGGSPRGGSLLAGYRDAGGSYPAGTAARFVGYHARRPGAARPASSPRARCSCSRGARCGAGRRSRARAPTSRSTLATAVWLVLEVGVFASRELGLLAERNLIAAAPLLFLGFALWLDRGGPGPLLVRALAAAAVAVAIVLLPLRKLVVPDALPHAFTLIPLSHLRDADLGRDDAARRRARRRRRGRALRARAAARARRPAGAALRRARGRLGLGEPRGGRPGARAAAAPARARCAAGWTTPPTGRPRTSTTARPTGTRSGRTCSGTAASAGSTTCPARRSPGRCRRRPLGVRPGRRAAAGRRRVAGAAFAVVPLHIALRGEKVAEARQVGTDRQGLGLWRLDRPLRLDTITSGLFENGDVDREATLTAYDCRAGTFDAQTCS